MQIYTKKRENFTQKNMFAVGFVFFPTNSVFKIMYLSSGGEKKKASEMHFTLVLSYLQFKT